MLGRVVLLTWTSGFFCEVVRAVSTLNEGSGSETVHSHIYYKANKLRPIENGQIDVLRRSRPRWVCASHVLYGLF
jgi:hypothetical protein